MAASSPELTLSLIRTDDIGFVAEGCGERETDVAEADDGYFCFSLFDCFD